MSNNKQKSRDMRQKGKEHTTKGSKTQSGNKFIPKEGENRDNSHLKNDWSFYAVNEQMARDVANLPFNFIPGTTFPSTDGSFTPTATSLPLVNHLPGVMAIRYIPGPGTSTDATSGVNMAARQMYSFIRRANSGARNYEAPDLMMYLLAMESVYIRYFEARRVYALARTYYFMNRNLPDTVIRSVGIDAVDLRANLAAYRYRLNILREKINSMAIPQGFSSFKRRVVLSSQIYSDSSSLRSGIYVFNSGGYYIYKPTKYTTGGALEFTLMSTGTPVTLQTWLDVIDDMITAIITDDDMNTMSGDIIKAFGANGLYSVADVPEDIACHPVYDEDILAQIENSISWNINVAAQLDNTYDTLDIYQKDNTLFYQPLITSPNAAGTDQARANYVTAHTTHIINSHKDAPDAKDVLEWSRLMAVAIEGSDVLRSGLEIVIGYSMWAVKSDGVTFEVVGAGGSIVVNATTQAVNLTDALTWFLASKQFDWSPRVRLATLTATMDIARIFPMNMDLKVFTNVNAEILSNMHDVANYSVYYTNLY